MLYEYLISAQRENFCEFDPPRQRKFYVKIIGE